MAADRREAGGMPVLTVTELSRRFVGAVALDKVELSVGRGEVHGLLGGNGAGKSTLVKILAGIERADAGEVTVQGRLLPRSHKPGDVADAGLRFVHQDPGLVDEMSVAENIAIVAGYPSMVGLIDHRGTKRLAKGRLAQLAPHLDVDRLVGELSQAEKVIVAIARALDEHARLVVLDEPTASLPAYETELLHNSLRAAQNAGCSFILVTHRLSEVFQLCDTATVLAAGRNVFSGDVKSLSYDDLVRMVAGRAVDHGRKKHEDVRPKTVRLEARGLLGEFIQSPISLSVRAGEVLAVTGLVGSGYLELAAWLSGMSSPSAGALYVDGASVPFGNPQRLRNERIELVVGDRSLSTFPHLTVLENLFANGIGTGKKISLSSREEKRQTMQTIRRFNVKPSDSIDRSILSLSGGNQQKVVFLRAMARQPKVLILIDPTSGVDIGGRAELYEILQEQLNANVAVVLSSSDLDEVATLADEAFVMRAGRIGAHLRGPEIDEERLAAESHMQSAIVGSVE